MTELLPLRSSFGVKRKRRFAVGSVFYVSIVCTLLLIFGHVSWWSSGAHAAADKKLRGNQPAIPPAQPGPWDKTSPIPNVIHQTAKHATLRPTRAQESWVLQNPFARYDFYDDERIESFVSTHFPEYVDAFNGLPSKVTRSDFFRYLVLLQFGGVYSDMDTLCIKPLKFFPTDRLVVGQESYFSSAAIAKKRTYARPKQYLQWTIASVPGHPALREVADTIAESVLSGKFDTYVKKYGKNRAVLELTGPGVWTDTVRRHMEMHDDHGVRILPVQEWGDITPMQELDRYAREAVVVKHEFQGSWKYEDGEEPSDGETNPFTGVEDPKCRSADGCKKVLAVRFKLVKMENPNTKKEDVERVIQEAISARMGFMMENLVIDERLSKITFDVIPTTLLPLDAGGVGEWISEHGEATIESVQGSGRAEQHVKLAQVDYSIDTRYGFARPGDKDAVQQQSFGGRLQEYSHLWWIRSMFVLFVSSMSIVILILICACQQQSNLGKKDKRRTR